MSGLASIALAASMSSVSFGGRPPVRAERRAAARPAWVRSRLFDHVVGAAEDRLRHGEAERLGGREIDDQREGGAARYRDRPAAKARSTPLSRAPLPPALSRHARKPHCSGSRGKRSPWPGEPVRTAARAAWVSAGRCRPRRQSGSSRLRSSPPMPATDHSFPPPSGIRYARRMAVFHTFCRRS